jgi:hypothetical protein
MKEQRVGEVRVRLHELCESGLCVIVGYGLGHASHERGVLLAFDALPKHVQNAK